MIKLVSPFTLAVASLLTILIVISQTTAQTPPTPGFVTYRYDNLGRVAQDIYPANSLSYSYDQVGNRNNFTMN
jgi:hypothetical protein